MKQTKRLVDQITKLLQEVMGEQTAQLFHTFYEKEDEDEVLAGARSLLYELMGRDMTDKKLKELLAKS
jgi:hypothetical protein